jgi:hypothetical protein
LTHVDKLSTTSDATQSYSIGYVDLLFPYGFGRLTITQTLQKKNLQLSFMTNFNEKYRPIDRIDLIPKEKKIT